MIQELKGLQYLKKYKEARVEFLKAEGDDYIEHLQMLVYLKGFKNPVFATKINSFEFYTSRYYKMNRRWANIPFIFDPVEVEVEKIKLKKAEHQRLSKFLSKFTLKTSLMILEEVNHSIYDLNGCMFKKKDEKPKKEKEKFIRM